jgi:hypothetical protein
MVIFCEDDIWLFILLYTVHVGPAVLYFQLYLRDSTSLWFSGHNQWYLLGNVKVDIPLMTGFAALQAAKDGGGGGHR